jgi:hypothetical protein
VNTTFRALYRPVELVWSVVVARAGELKTVFNAEYFWWPVSNIAPEVFIDLDVVVICVVKWDTEGHQHQLCTDDCDLNKRVANLFNEGV